MTRRFWIIALGAGMLAVGCAGYGFADDPTSGDDTAERLLRVEPVAAEAHLGFDRSELRARLVDQLQLAGIAETSRPTAPLLRCAVVEPDITGFGTDLVAELVVSCHILRSSGDSPVHTVEVRGLGAEQLDADRRLSRSALDGTRRVGMAATDAAFSRIATDVARVLDDTDPSPSSTEQHRDE